MSSMDPAQPWTPIPGEKVQPEPYSLGLPFDETIQSWDSRYPFPLSKPRSSIRGMPIFSSYQTGPASEQTGQTEGWNPNEPSEGQQYSHQGYLDTQVWPLTFASCCTQPALPQTLTTQPGLDISESIGLQSHTFHCFWAGCKARTKFFLLSTDLAHHIQTYHLHRCPWPTCSIRKPFHRRSDLTRHLASVHSGSRNHRCDAPGCGKAYSRSDKLTAHKRIHDNRMDTIAGSITNPATLHIPAAESGPALDTSASNSGMVHMASSISIHDFNSLDSTGPGSVPSFLDFWIPIANPQGGQETLPSSNQGYLHARTPYPSMKYIAQQESDLPLSPDNLVAQEQDSVLTQANNGSLSAHSTSSQNNNPEKHGNFASVHVNLDDYVAFLSPRDCYLSLE